MTGCPRCGEICVDATVMRCLNCNHVFPKSTKTTNAPPQAGMAYRRAH